MSHSEGYSESLPMSPLSSEPLPMAPVFSSVASTSVPTASHVPRHSMIPRTPTLSMSVPAMTVFPPAPALAMPSYSSVARRLVQGEHIATPLIMSATPERSFLSSSFNETSSSSSTSSTSSTSSSTSSSSATSSSTMSPSIRIPSSPNLRESKISTPVPDLLKIILIGDGGVGKSSLLMKYIEDNFNPEFRGTIGVDFRSKRLMVNQQLVRLQIYDTAGQECYRSITRGYYRQANGICFIFDLTYRNSFVNIRAWLNDVDSTIQYPVAKILVGMKRDLVCSSHQNEQTNVQQDLGGRQVSMEEAQELAEQLGMDYVEASAKTGFGIENVFLTLASTALGASESRKTIEIIAETLVEIQPEAPAEPERRTRCCRWG